MRFVTALMGASLAAFCAAHPGWPQHPGNGDGPRYHHGPQDEYGQRAVYFLRVDPAGSSVVAIQVGKDGMLEGSTSVTSTHGMGEQSQNASVSSLPPTAIDPLQGQQAISIGDDYLFTINSGSNTAVMFKIDPHDPLRLVLVGEPMPTLGEFAMSIAYSSKHRKACVLNGGAVNGVTCYHVDASEGLSPDGVGLRGYGFPATTPAQLGGAKGSGSDIQFATDSSKLITTFKGEAKPEQTLGHITVFDVDEGGNVAKTPTDNRVAPLSVPFGFALNGENPRQMYISDASFGGALVSLDENTNEVLTLAVVNDTALAASCWAVWSEVTGIYYDIDAGSANIGKVDADGKLTGSIKYDESLAGGLDSVVEGTKLYMLTATNAIAVIDLESGDLLQRFEYGSMADRPTWTGLAMWPASPLLSGGY